MPRTRCLLIVLFACIPAGCTGDDAEPKGSTPIVDTNPTGSSARHAGLSELLRLGEWLGHRAKVIPPKGSVSFSMGNTSRMRHNLTGFRYLDAEAQSELRGIRARLAASPASTAEALDQASDELVAALERLRTAATFDLPPAPPVDVPEPLTYEWICAQEHSALQAVWDEPWPELGAALAEEYWATSTATKALDGADFNEEAWLGRIGNMAVTRARLVADQRAIAAMLPKMEAALEDWSPTTTMSVTRVKFAKLHGLNGTIESFRVHPNGPPNKKARALDAWSDLVEKTKAQIAALEAEEFTTEASHPGPPYVHGGLERYARTLNEHASALEELHERLDAELALERRHRTVTN